MQLCKTRKAQASIEYSAVLAAMLISLVIVVIILTSVFAQDFLQSGHTEAEHTVNILATAAREVYLEGKGARLEYKLSIPHSASLSESFFSNNTISLYLDGFGDVSERVDFNISGKWPNDAGTYYALIENNGTQILIFPSPRLSISKSGFYFNHSTSESDSALVVFKNLGEKSINLTQTLNFSSCPGCTYNMTGVKTLTSGMSMAANLSIPVLSSGIYSGFIDIRTSPFSSEIYKEMIIIPITVRVS